MTRHGKTFRYLLNMNQKCGFSTRK